MQSFPGQRFRFPCKRGRVSGRFPNYRNRARVAFPNDRNRAYVAIPEIIEIAHRVRFPNTRNRLPGHAKSRTAHDFQISGIVRLPRFPNNRNRAPSAISEISEISHRPRFQVSGIVYRPMFPFPGQAEWRIGRDFQISGIPLRPRLTNKRNLASATFSK